MPKFELRPWPAVVLCCFDARRTSVSKKRSGRVLGCVVRSWNSWPCGLALRIRPIGCPGGRQDCCTCPVHASQSGGVGAFPTAWAGCPCDETGKPPVALRNREGACTIIRAAVVITAFKSVRPARFIMRGATVDTATPIKAPVTIPRRGPVVTHWIGR